MFIRTILIILILVSKWSLADDQVLDIGILRDYKTSQVMFGYYTETYHFYADSEKVFTLEPGMAVRIKNSDGKVKLKNGDITIGSYSKLSIKSDSMMGAFKLKGLYPSLKERRYKGDLKVLPEGKYLKMINEVSMEDYLIGVIESETGNNESKEFYKVQAVISRTYALKHLRKFIHEGFMLTDLTNCQVYKGKMYQNPKIIQAVKETRNMVLVDDEMKYITAAFYSNSGGQTVNCEDVWDKPLPYLKSVKDPFSKGRTNYSWTKIIDKSKWLEYLKNKHRFPVEDSVAVSRALSFTQEKRRKYYIDWEYHILLKDIRMDWRLKSTYFSVSVDGSNVILKGKGFGHGVGLSQEGAMNMCDLGYGYEDVLRFYYTQAHLIDLDQREFFLSD